jgi:hypothetical protein
MSEPEGACCARCAFFAAGARELEARLPGLKTLGSAWGSVRADDGLCHLHDRYVAAASVCAGYRVLRALAG